MKLEKIPASKIKHPQKDIIYPKEPQEGHLSVLVEIFFFFLFLVIYHLFPSADFQSGAEVMLTLFGPVYSTGRHISAALPSHRLM